MLQSEALDILKMGHNVFLTGAAGSGKTHTLREYVSYLKRHNIEVAITASTGIAATHLGGMTIHAWSGLGVKDSLTEYDIDNLEEKQYLWKRYADTKVLIIDEVSMLHHFRFDLLNKLAQTFKRNDLPFGGMQVILCGDFFQLPPVSRPGEPEGYFAYRSKIWSEMNLKVCYLTEQHRQNDDMFLSVLNNIRDNDIDEGTLEYLQERYNAELEEGISPTKLFTHNEDVDMINERELVGISGHEETYLMQTKGKSNLVQTLIKSCLAPEDLRLKVGAKVMFVKNNLEKGYVNGTLGVVDSFAGDHYPIIRLINGKKIKAEPESWRIEEEGKVKAEILQVPLRLAWAITIHKSQGMSLDAAEIDLSKTFVPGMGYVALSRVKSLKGLRLLGFNPRALAMHPEIIEIDRDLRRQSDKARNELIEIENGFGQYSLQEIQDNFILKNAGFKKVVGINSSGLGDLDDEGDLDQVTKTKKAPAHMITLDALEQKQPLAHIAKERKIKLETVLDHIEKLFGEDKMRGIDISYIKHEFFKDPRSRLKFSKIKDELKTQKLKEGEVYRLAPAKQKLGNSVSYIEIRLVKILLLGENL